jgi:hypothetical protein
VTDRKTATEDKKYSMESILSAVSDCDAVLALRAATRPRRSLRSRGIRVISTYDRIEDAVLKAAASQ